MLPDRSWLAIACFLVDHGADLDAVDIRGNTPLSHVKNDAIVQLLRKRARSGTRHIFKGFKGVWYSYHGKPISKPQLRLPYEITQCCLSRWTCPVSTPARQAGTQLISLSFSHSWPTLLREVPEASWVHVVLSFRPSVSPGLVMSWTWKHQVLCRLVSAVAVWTGGGVPAPSSVKIACQQC